MEGFDIDKIFEEQTKILKQKLTTIGDRVLVFGKEILGNSVGNAPAGQPPHKDTGTLQNSLKKKVSIEGRDIVLTVFTTDDAAKVMSLEYGSKTKRPRPFMRPIKIEMERIAKETL